MKKSTKKSDESSHKASSDTKIVVKKAKDLKVKHDKKVKAKKARKPMPKALRIITWPFRMIAKPFIALGRYIHDSWLELRQVRWPSRGATWKMFLAILVYVVFFMTLVALLDLAITWLFNLIIG